MLVKDIFALWPSTAALAADLGAAHETVRKWKTRRRIPSRHFGRIAQAAKKRRIPLSLQDLHAGDSA